MEKTKGKSAKIETGVTWRKGKFKEIGKNEIKLLGKNEKNGGNCNFIKVLKKTIEDEKLELIKKIEENVNELTDHLVSTVEANMEWNVPDRTDRTSMSSSSSPSSKSTFHEKTYQVRNSLLTDLFKVNHISTIYHIFIAFLINLFINTAVSDVVKFGKINLGFRLICWNFQSLPMAALLWLIMQLSTVAVYFLFIVWAKRRVLLLQPFKNKFWDVTFLAVASMYMLCFLVAPAWFLLKQRWPIAVSFLVLMEQVRFLMKTYSFIRTVVPRITKAIRPKKTKSFFPAFGTYVYFLFAPTLIYRDEYPKTTKIRWKVVFQHFTEVIGVIFYLAFIMENYLIPSMKNFGKTHVTVEELLIVFFNNNVPCVFAFLCGFYSFLHSWMNAFAELLKFADRMFYQDWWNSSSFAEFYKTWNIIVHDWLYAFVYKDGTEILTKRKMMSTWLVFIISALFHEYILAFTFRFCYPVLFIVFGIIGTCLMFVPKKRTSAVGNMFLWLGIFTGIGCCGSLYMLEYYARINCLSPKVSPVADFFIPRSWICIFGNIN